ncbi:hypothetical protein V6N13_058192 [Hibiscus sabdariffa]
MYRLLLWALINYGCLAMNVDIAAAKQASHQSLPLSCLQVSDRSRNQISVKYEGLSTFASEGTVPPMMAEANVKHPIVSSYSMRPGLASLIPKTQAPSSLIIGWRANLASLIFKRGN